LRPRQARYGGESGSGSCEVQKFTAPEFHCIPSDVRRAKDLGTSTQCSVLEDTETARCKEGVMIERWPS